MAWEIGDSIIVECDGKSVPGSVVLSSENGKSLAVAFEGKLGMHAGGMLLTKLDEERYQSVVDNVVVTVTPNDIPSLFPRHYKLEGKTVVPCHNVMEWGMAFTSQDRHVAATHVGILHVSTVFIGLDHSFGEGDPLLFETMIFGADGEWRESYMDRCSTWEQAEAMHKKAVAFAVAHVREADASIRDALNSGPKGD
jgi:hypothetical protein